MTSNADYWAHVSASFVGTAIVVLILSAIGLITQLILSKRARGGDGGNVRPETSDERSFREQIEPFTRNTEQVDEGRLRVAVRRSSEHPDPVAKRQEQLDAAAVRRGEETQPVAAVQATIRREMTRVMLCEPPMVEGMTLFSWLKHHAPQPSGLAWDAEDMGVLANVTHTLYEDARHDPLVKHVFDGYDLDELRRHFVRALMTLTKDGLDVETADALGRAHERLRIRPEQFDAVIGHFVQALKRFLSPQVFESVLAQLGARNGVVDQLRKRIVTARGAG